MKSKEITVLVTEYDSILHEFDRLKGRQNEIIAELLDAKLPDENKKVADIVQEDIYTVNQVIKANYPEESRYFYRTYDIAMRVKNRKDCIDRETKEKKWEPKFVPDGRTYKEKPRYWSELTM